MKNKILKLMLIFVVSATIISCEEEAGDTTPTTPVTNARAVAQDLSVLIKWEDPTDSDFKEVIISHINEIGYQAAVVLPGVEQRLIEGLTNDQSHTFTITAIDKSGNESEEVQVTATPVLTVFHIYGDDIENGIYTDTESGILTTYEFSGSNSLNISVQAAASTFSWEGTWTKNWDELTTVLENTYTQETHTNLVSGAFCFELDGYKYYYHGAFDKRLGENSELAGEYFYSIYSTDGGTNLIKKITIAENGAYDYYEDNALVESGTITEENIRNRDYIMISNYGIMFLYFDKSFVLKKQ